MGTRASQAADSGVDVDRQAGSVTAELAIGLSSVMVVLAAVLGVLSVGVAQLRVSQAAAAGARVVARGGSVADATGLAARLGGEGALARVATQPEVQPGGTTLVQMVVTREVSLPLPGRPAVQLLGSATAVDEAVPP